MAHCISPPSLFGPPLTIDPAKHYGYLYTRLVFQYSSLSLIVDVVKSRLQVVTSGGGRKYNGTWDCVVQSYRNEGIRTFYRGISPALCRAAPVNAAVFKP